jgi:hypothetical protein
MASRLVRFLRGLIFDEEGDPLWNLMWLVALCTVIGIIIYGILV